MKKIISIILLASSHLVNAEDIRDKVRTEAKEEISSIEPGKHAYGIPWGTTEDEFIRIEGKPDGYIKLTNERTAMLYGKSHVFIFLDGKFNEIRIASQVLDYKLAAQVSDNFKRRSSNWKLTNGAREGMSEEQLKELLGENLKSDKYGAYFLVNGYRVDLGFVEYSNGQMKGRRTVHGIYITPNKENKP